MAPTILGNANAILAIPNVPGSGSGPATNFIILENGVDQMLTENNADLMIRE
tara:strand:+ start:347 stop:502 length:156 start_codon:yes stop_codon:yes gene_type:complete